MNNEVRDVLKAQRRRRRRNFWAGFAVLALVGGVWAQLSKDPFGPNFGQGFDDAVEDAPAVEVFEQGEFEEPPTTIPAPPVPPTIAPVPPTVPLTTVAP